MGVGWRRTTPAEYDHQQQAALRSASYRSCQMDRDRVIALHFDHSVAMFDIPIVTGISSSNVKRWLNHPETRQSPGRPAYLDQEDHDRLFKVMIPSKFYEHEAMTTVDIIQEVKYYPQLI